MLPRLTITCWCSRAMCTSTAGQKSSIIGLELTCFSGRLLRLTTASLPVWFSAVNWTTELRVSGKSDGVAALLLYNTPRKCRLPLCR